MPKDKRFFDMIERQSETVLTASKSLTDILKTPNGVMERLDEIKKIENECDDITHGITNELNRTFITPIDREDILNLTSRLDDIVDRIYAATNRVYIYGMAPTEPMLQVSDIIVKSVETLNKAIKFLRNSKNFDKVEECCIEINRLENEADTILRTSLAELFKEQDVIRLIKLKEIIEILEAATDLCESAASIVTDIVAKNR